MAAPDRPRAGDLRPVAAELAAIRREAAELKRSGAAAGDLVGLFGAIARQCDRLEAIIEAVRIPD